MNPRTPHTLIRYQRKGSRQLTGLEGLAPYQTETACVRGGVSPGDGQSRGYPVVKHAEHGVYVPELIFDYLLTSSNYDDTRKKVTGGRTHKAFFGSLTWAFHRLSLTRLPHAHPIHCSLFARERRR